MSIEFTSNGIPIHIVQRNIMCERPQLEGIEVISLTKGCAYESKDGERNIFLKPSSNITKLRVRT